MDEIEFENTCSRCGVLIDVGHYCDECWHEFDRENAYEEDYERENNPSWKKNPDGQPIAKPMRVRVMDALIAKLSRKRNDDDIPF